MKPAAKIKLLNPDEGVLQPTITELRNELRVIRALMERVAAKLDYLEPPSGSTASQNRQVREILKEVAAFYDFTPVQILSRTRTENLCWARHVAMTLARELTEMSLMQIGRVFERDHGSVVNAVENVTNRCSVDASKRVAVEHLRENLRLSLNPQPATGAHGVTRPTNP